MATATRAKPHARKRKASGGRSPQFWSYRIERTKFRSRWIAFEGDVIHAVGDDAGDVYAEARRHTTNPVLELVMPARALY